MGTPSFRPTIFLVSVLDQGGSAAALLDEVGADVAEVRATAQRRLAASGVDPDARGEDDRAS
jgi:hypothetical protein